MKIFICILVFSAAITGCAQKSSPSKNEGAFAYGERQAWMEQSPMEQWRDMRQQSEVMELSHEKWVPKPKSVQAKADAETKRRTGTSVAKTNSKPAKQVKKTDEASASTPGSAASKESSS